MNRKTFLCLLAATFVAVFGLVACSRDGDDTTDTTAATTTEAATTLPRYDYFAGDVSPNVNLAEADYTNVTLTINNALRVDDEDVADYMDAIRFQHRTAENGDTQVKDQPLKLGDSAFIYYRGYVDGVAFDGGSNWDETEPAELGLGSGNFIAGFEAGLVGVVPNTTSRETPFELHVTFPEDYKEELAGKAAVFQVYVAYAVQYTMPEYTRDFIINTLEHETQKSFYASDKALLTEFEALVRSQLEADMQEDIEMYKVDALWTHLVTKATFRNLSQDEVNYYFSTYRDQAKDTYDYYAAIGNATFNATYPDLGSFVIVYYNLQKGADWETQLREYAERMVKKDMVIHALAERMGMESITDEEYRARVLYWVNYYDGYIDESGVESTIGRATLMKEALEEKVQKTLFERFVFTYEDGTPLGGTTEAESGS